MLKRIKLIIFLTAFIIMTGVAIFINSFSTILAEVATGSAIDRNEHKYWVATGIGGENRISCSQEQYDKYTGDTDIGRTDTLFVVIYERKLLIPSQQKVIQVKKYKDHWNDELHKRIIPNKTFYRLVQEDFTSINNRQSILTRVFECYQSGDSQMKLVADNYLAPYFDNINSIKEWMKSENSNLQLKPLTIVSDNVLNKWKQEEYVPTIEYSAKSPQGLSYEELVKQEEVKPTTTPTINLSETIDEKKDEDSEEVDISDFKPIKEFFIAYDFDINKNGTKAEPISFTVQGEYDLNQDGSLDTINILLLSHLGREKDVQAYIQVNHIKKEFYMDYTIDGEVRIIDLDPNDKFFEIAYFDEGPSGDPHYIFYRYDGKELYKIGSIDSYALFDGKGRLLPRGFVSKFEPAFFSAWCEIEDNKIVDRVNNIDNYLGKTYKFFGGEAYFIPAEEMPKNFVPVWEEQKNYEVSDVKVIDVYFYPEDRVLNFYFVEFPNGEKGMLYFWMGD